MQETLDKMASISVVMLLSEKDGKTHYSFCTQALKTDRMLALSMSGHDNIVEPWTGLRLLGTFAEGRAPF